MEPILEIGNLCLFQNKQEILSSINITFEKGLIYGIIGGCGSGKSMLCQCICGKRKADRGSISAFGKVVGKDTYVPVYTGMMLEKSKIYSCFNGFKNIKFLSGITDENGKERIATAMKEVGLEPGSREHVKQYSQFRRRKLLLAAAIVNAPRLLVLDEPLRGLNEEERREMKELLLIQQSKGVTIILTCAEFYEIEMLCDVVYEMQNGQLDIYSNYDRWEYIPDEYYKIII